MDYIQFCKNYFASSHLPMILIENHQVIFTAGLDHLVSPEVLCRRILQTADSFPYLLSVSSGFYGMLQIAEKDQLYLFLGPSFTGTLTDELLSEYMKDNMIAHSLKEDTRSRLSILPSFTYYRFVSTITFLEFVINGDQIEWISDLHITDDRYKEEIAAAQTETAYEQRDLQMIHGTYLFEQQILDLVREGKPDALEKLLLNTVQNGILNEGTVGNTPLRQAKNVFISNVAITGKQAAIPGGLNIEQTYQLIDTYSQECEQLTTVTDVNNLQYNMLLDFADRVSKAKMPSGISSDVYACIQYINNHLNEPVSIDDVAAHIHRSRVYTINHFKDELGFHIGEYITHARIQEAKSLLRYTDKALSEISSYLCYSSQSYFQNVFKKITGITPKEYRKKAGNLGQKLLP